MTNKIVLKKHQCEFIDASEQYVGLFGGVGNGKTYIACAKIIELLAESPGNLCLVGRQTYPELRDSTREVFLGLLSKLYPPDAYKFNKSENSITLWNKSVCIFRHLDEWQSLLSMNLGAFYIDQAEQVDEDAFLTLQSRLRRQNVKRHKGLVTGNPKGHNWIYYKFGMQDANGSTNYAFNNNYRMITAPTIANADNLPANYIQQLQESYSPEWFARYVKGSWDAFEGQIFDLTKIRGYDKLPEMKMILTACDPAISKHKDACNTAFTTLGVGEDGYIYDLETIAGKWGFLEQLDQIKGIISRNKPRYIGVEDAAYQSALTEATYAAYSNHGEIEVVNVKADKDKFRRAKSVSHIVNRGLFRTNNKDLMNEVSAFVPDAEGKERKDRVDALVHCLHMVQKYAPVIKQDPNPLERFKGKTSSEIFLMRSLEEEKAQMRGEQYSTVIFDRSRADEPQDPNFY